jgi:hypothetical protein
MLVNPNRRGVLASTAAIRANHRIIIIINTLKKYVHKRCIAVMRTCEPVTQFMDNAL